MPKYKITDKTTGQSLIVSGDAPPNEQSIAEIFSQRSGTQPAQQPQSFARKRFPFAMQGIEQAQRGNPIGGGINIANQAVSEGFRPFTIINDFLRNNETINPSVFPAGKASSNLLMAIPAGASAAYNLAKGGLNATGIPNALNNILPLDKINPNGETSRALDVMNQNLSALVAPQIAMKGISQIPSMVGKGRQVVADALSQSGYKIPPSVKASERTQLLRTAQKENIVPTKKGLERLDSKVSELKSTAEGLEQKAMQGETKTVPTSEMVQSIDGLLEKWSKSDTPKDFTRVLTDYRQKVLAQQKPDLSIQDMIDLKRNLQKQLSDVYVKQMKINPTIRQNLLQEAKGSVESSVRQKLEEIIPDYKNTNSQIHKLLKLKPYVEQAANRISNQDLTTIRLKDVLLGGGVAGMGADPISIASSIVVGRVLTDQRVQAYLGNKLSSEYVPKTTGINIKDFPVNPEFYAEANRLGVRIDKSQDVKGGKSMPLFTDNKTGSTFTIQKGETLADAVNRVRKAHNQPRMTWQEALAEQEKRKNK